MRKITFKILTKLPTKYIDNGLIFIAALFIYGIFGSHYIMKLNLVDSVYYAVITMTTVGYGDYLPSTGIQKIFATTLALGGVALLAYVFNIILTNFQERMEKFSKGAIKMRTIKNMDDYFILCGSGIVCGAKDIHKPGIQGRFSRPKRAAWHRWLFLRLCYRT